MTLNLDKQLVLGRRKFLGYSAAGVVAAWLGSSTSAVAQQAGINKELWTPEYVASIAGTEDVDTAAECAKVVPLDYSGKLTYWYVGPTQASPELEHKIYDEFWAAFASTYPNITVEKQSVDYNSMLDKLRTAVLGNAAPMVARLPILWGVEFGAKGQLSELGPQDVGHSVNDFWPGAMKSVTWQGKTYGVPTNNETQAFIWNAAIFEEAGLDPEVPPRTWDELVSFSRQIKERTGKNGYGMVARVNAGHTPYRVLPQMWSYGGGVYDEADPSPQYRDIRVNNSGTRAAMQLFYDMYVRDKSVPASALTNTQNENQDPFIAGQLGMMTSHPSEYAVMVDRASKATGADKETADRVVANMRYGLMPEGPMGRAVVFGGFNIHVFNQSVVDRGELDMQAAKAFVAFSTGPEWSTKLAWVGSNPGNIRGFKTQWMKERLAQIKFLSVTTAMLAYGIPFPIVPESTEIMNIIVPEMLQNILTERMTIEDATDDAAKKVLELRGS